MLFVAIFAGALYLLFNIVPIVALFGLATWAIIKLIKLISSWYSKWNIKGKGSMDEVVQHADDFDLTNKQIIDVDYKEL